MEYVQGYKAMKNFIEWFFDFENKRQIPRSMVILTFACMACVFVPEYIWNMMGVDVNKNWSSLPEFLQRNLKDMEYKTGAYMFWIVSPFISIINFIVFVIKHNTTGYFSYLKRRVNSLEVKNKSKNSWRWSLIFQLLIVVLIYIYFVPFTNGEPMIFGDFVISKSRMALILIHGTALLYIFPIVFTILFTEIRAGLTNTIFDEEVK